MAEPIDEDDDGLAPERTLLAWNRTGIAFFVAIAALGRRVWPIDTGNHGWVVAALGAATLAILAGLLVAGRVGTHDRYAGTTMHRHTLPARLREHVRARVRRVRPRPRPRMTDATRRRLAVATIALPVLLLAVAAWQYRWMSDDGFINLRIVHNITSGHGPVFNVAMRRRQLKRSQCTRCQ